MNTEPLSMATSPAANDSHHRRLWDRLIARHSDPSECLRYGVTTTAIFCRIGCPSPAPRRDHLVFFDDAATALRSGYAPCKRCRPLDEADAMTVARQQVAMLCRIIEAASEPPSLSVLAGFIESDGRRVQRLFRDHCGISPKQYGLACRRRRLEHKLNTQKRDDVTTILYDAGFGSTARAYAQIKKEFGMTPQAYQRGGDGMVIRHMTAPSSLGLVGIAATAKGLCAVEFAPTADRFELQQKQRFPLASLIPAKADSMVGGLSYVTLVQAVIAAIDDESCGDLPLDIRGTVFQHRVWCALTTIPHGTTIDYSMLAARSDCPAAVRAAAGACGANPLAVLIPCHRVIRRDGGLGGYRWGLERKRRLLERECEG